MEIRVKYVTLAILLLSLIIFTSATYAETHTVEGTDFSSIEAVVNSTASNDIIHLLPTTYTGSGKAISFSKEVNSHTITITTPLPGAKATLDAKAKSNIANIGSAYTVNFINIDFINGNTAGNGGAVLVNGNVNFTNCRFTGNTAANGGAVALMNNVLVRANFDNCMFTSNRATNMGGAIYTSNFNLDLRYTTLTSNTAVNGGALYFNYGNNLIFSSTFTNNIATSSGGAIYYNQAISMLQQSSFTGNKAYMGSAIYNANNAAGSLNIYSSNFANNLIIPRISFSVPPFVNCTENAVVSATISGSNNVLNAIYNIGSNLRINYAIPTQTNSLLGQTITLSVNGRTFTGRTDASGRASFQFNTAGFPITNVPLKFTCLASAGYSSVAVNSALRVTNKIIITISYSKAKTYKKATVTSYAKIVTPIYQTIRSTVSDKYYTIINNEYSLSGRSSTIQMLRKEVGSSIRWIKLTKKNTDLYRWNEQKKDTKNFKIGTRTTLTYLNGKLVSRVVKKKVKFTVITSKKLRDDWTGYLAETNNCNPYSPRLQGLVKPLIKGKKTDSQKANAIWNWIIKNVKYDYDIYGGTRLGSEGMLTAKKGNCLDHAHLTVAMFRAAGLPAVYEYKARADGNAHAWTKVYVNKKWQYADTVLKSGGMSGQASWINARVLNNDPNNHFIVINYNKHQNIRINGFWQSLYREILYQGTSVPFIMYNL